MRLIITTLILALTAPVFFQGCSPNLVPYYYRGDGNFDNRFGVSAFERYKLSLGEFNTSRPEKATYRIGPLPAKFVAEKRFHFGLSTNVDLDDYFFSRDSDDLLPERYISQEIQQMAHVRIRIVDEETGEVVAEENESLADLAWSYSYTNDGKVENVRFLLFDLTPVRGHTYKLEFEIDHPDKFNIPLRLEATGGQVAIYSLL